MPRLENVHPHALAVQNSFHAETIREIQTTIARDKVVVIGMAWNVPVKKARRFLEDHKVAYTYLEYGNYITGWRKRLAIKMWSGWPTFPHVFINGALVGGASDLLELEKSGELKKLLEASR